MARILAVDYGLKRVGIAVTDPLQLIAGGLTTISTDEIFSFLKDYLSKEKVEKVVVGYPIDMFGHHTDATPAVDKFIAEFRKTFPEIPLFKADERYTSKMAVQTIIKSGIKKKQRRNKELVDKVSATIILQSFLEKYNR